MEWVGNNVLKVNPDKFHLILSNTDQNFSVNVDQYEISKGNYEKLLWVTIDNKLKFDKHVSGLCKKASQNFMPWPEYHLNTMKRRTVMNAFISSQFGYCSLVWMFHSRMLNNRINKIHERALRIVHNDDQSSSNELLNKENSFTIHVQRLAIEI